MVRIGTRADERMGSGMPPAAEAVRNFGRGTVSSLLWTYGLLWMAGCQVDFSLPPLQDGEPKDQGDAVAWPGDAEFVWEDGGAEVVADGEPAPWPDSGWVEDAAIPVLDASFPWDGGSGHDARIGDPCDLDSDCVLPAGLVPDCAGSLMGLVEFPGGYCTAECTPGEPDPCEPDGVCCGPGNIGFCMKPCASDDDCRVDEGYRCLDPALTGVAVCATE